MPKQTAKAASIRTAGAAALAKAIKRNKQSGKAAPIMPTVPTEESKWQSLNCIVLAEVKLLVLQEAEQHDLSVNRVVQNALYARYGMPETPGTEEEADSTSELNLS